MYLTRHLEPKIKMLQRNFPVVIVSGARQVGKSTLLEHLFPEYKRVVFDPLIDVEGARNDPDLFLQNNPTPLILDEIQYSPQLVPAIKRALDKNRSNGQFLITGSQQWEVIKNLQESLAGRAVFLDLYPFSIAENTGNTNVESSWLQHLVSGKKNFINMIGMQKPKFSLYEQTWRGFYPEAQVIEKDAIPYFFQGYERTYIERDIRNMAGISNVELFSRFYRLCAALSSKEINHSHMGRELGLSPDTAKRWLNMLKATFQWIEIPPFYGNTIKRISKKHKGYLADCGIICHALGISNPSVLANHPSWGAIFETFAVLDILKQLQLFGSQPQCYHYRSTGGAEVDLIVESDGILYPIEIKGKSRPTKRDTRGIMSFKETFSKHKIGPAIIVSAGDEAYALKEDIWVVPINSKIGKLA